MVQIEKLKELNILYVDDDSVLCASTNNILTPLFCKVYIAKNGDEALEIYKHNIIHIIMMDIKMGRLSGIDVAKQIRVRDKKIPIFLVSSYTDVEDLLEAVKLDLVAYIKKPFSFKTLLDTFKECLEKMQLDAAMHHRLGENIYYDELSKKIYLGDKTILLTKSEINVIEIFIKKRNQLISYFEFINILGDEISEAALKNIIFRLRKKLGNTTIKNISKIGYMLT